MTNEKPAPIAPPAAEMSEEELKMLRWLAREDWTPLGSCEGKLLDRLEAAGLIHVSGNAVGVTDAGRAKLRQEQDHDR